MDFQFIVVEFNIGVGISIEQFQKPHGVPQKPFCGICRIEGCKDKGKNASKQQNPDSREGGNPAEIA
jgi:hypothetical protein